MKVGKPVVMRMTTRLLAAVAAIGTARVVVRDLLYEPKQAKKGGQRDDRSTGSAAIDAGRRPSGS